MELKTRICLKCVLCLLVHLVWLYSGVQADCSDVLNTVAPCFQTLEQGINATLQSVYNRTYVPLGNGVDSDYVYLAVRDEFCRTSNDGAVNCIQTNLTACPNVTVEETQFLFIDYIPQNLSIFNTTSLLCGQFSACQRTILPHYSVGCEIKRFSWIHNYMYVMTCSDYRAPDYLRTKGCEARDRMFEECYDDILPEFLINVASDIPLSRVCLERYRSNLTCMLESYKDCENVALQNNLSFFDLFKEDVYLDKWLLFESSDQLCNCTSKSTCQLNLDSILAEYNDRSVSKTVFEEYNKAIGYGESMCRGKEDAVCAYTGALEELCSQLPVYNDRQASYEQHYLFVESVCTNIESQEFTNNRRCVLNELSRELASCKNILPLDARNLTCVEMEYLYKCFYLILDHKCGDVTTTVFEIFQEYYVLPECEINTSHGNRVQSVSMEVCVVLAFLCILLAKFAEIQMNTSTH